jgi:hypothetical protein
VGELLASLQKSAANMQQLLRLGQLQVLSAVLLHWVMVSGILERVLHRHAIRFRHQQGYIGMQSDSATNTIGMQSDSAINRGQQGP